MQEGTKHSYIGLDIMHNQNTDRVSVGQSGDVLNRFAHVMHDARGNGRVPCGPEIVQPEMDENPEADRSLYMSIVMSVMFLARFTRPDLMFTVSMLTTHCANPNQLHMKYAIRLLKYIASTADMVIVYKSAMLNPIIYADASHATHHDGKGHGCIIVVIDTGIIYCRSYKLRIITLSSTESEFVAVCDASTLSLNG